MRCPMNSPLDDRNPLLSLYRPEKARFAGPRRAPQRELALAWESMLQWGSASALRKGARRSV